ncbi:MAG: aldo/keto reductase [Chthoniobacteraceae bacterium]|nr:aldo/keto reductase [Chthoniobacteraceae bacterium]
MQYTSFGNSGVQVSRLGFGSMRLPMVTVNEKRVVDEDRAIAMIRRAFELGVNYIDSAFFYCEGLSEIVVGKALKGWRDKVTLSTKFPFDKPFRETLETQLKKLDTDHIDFYHFHGIGDWFFTHERHNEAVNGAKKALEEGIIRHLSFSFHDKPEVMRKLIDTGLFSSVLCQYNLLDRANEESLAYAKAHGLGTAVMGPVGGGRISGMPPEVARRFGVQVKSNAELALRFVMTNPNVNVALSGMSTLQQVEENAAIASNAAPLSEAELSGIAAAMEENQRLSDLYCTGCNYCGPHCPQGIAIPKIFQLMNYHRVYRITDYARTEYRNIGNTPWDKSHKADECLECGVCEGYCPQKIEIRKQLKECHAALA